MSVNVAEDFDKRLKCLVDVVYNGNQASLANDANLTPSMISMLLSGNRLPGSRARAKLLNAASFSGEWLLYGTGNPPRRGASEVVSTSIPITKVPLEASGRIKGGKKAAKAPILSSRARLADMYWLEIDRSRASGLFCKDLGFREDDLVLFSRDSHQFPRPDSFKETLCIVSNPTSRGRSPVFALVSNETDLDSGGQSLVAKTRDRLSLIDQLTIVVTLKSERIVNAVTRRHTPQEYSNADNTNHVEFGDILAVWTGILLRRS